MEDNYLGLVASMTNVRELLELERNLYQENINRNQENLRALENGTFHEFVEQCVPFQNTRDKVLQVAKNHLHLMQRNAIDLLEFELQSANDIFTASISSAKQQLLIMTRNKLKRLRNQEQNQNPAPNQDGHYREDRKAFQGISDQERAFHHNFEAMKKAFDFQHLEPCLPTRTLIWEDLQLEIEAMKAYYKRQKLESTPSSTTRICLLDASRLQIDSTIFHIGQQVMVYSQLCDEELLGSIYELTKRSLKLQLVCQTMISISFDHIENREIRMYTESSEKITVDASLSDSKCDLYPKRKRLCV
uniref:Uncharacterized protein AlNc14C86G5485 n=1 Tax=Albugo laibachii Nc14 TaxID=890382 RepID=F0WFV0_9STRA|nr:conserved hypothetical protein [Albugo laibachii Nc14]|eukprot:CCA20084.1 conserved hypothetical protein [Albugo laibachii Nc14]